jgi:hypothetical protein
LLHTQVQLIRIEGTVHPSLRRVQWTGGSFSFVAKRNVLVLAAAGQSAAEADLQAEVFGLLDAHSDVDVLQVKLPRAEAMLAPRLIGLWNTLVFVGTTGSPSVPYDATVVQQQAQFLDEMPHLIVLGHAAELWAGWEQFHTVINRTGNCQSIEPNQPDAAARVVAAIRSQHSTTGNTALFGRNSTGVSDL